MGNRYSKSSLRNAIIYLNISADQISLDDDKFWSQIWLEDISTAAGVVKSISTQEIRMLRDGSPKNFATLTHKMVERLHLATGTLCNTQSQQTAVLNATRILIRLIPCIFEDRDWRNFFASNYIYESSGGEKTEITLVFPKKGDDEKNYRSYLPSGTVGSLYDNSDSEIDDYNNGRTSNVANLIETETNDSDGADINRSPIELKSCEPFPSSKTSSFEEMEGLNLDKSLIKLLMSAICDLLFCPEFTVTPHNDKYLNSCIDAPPEDLKSLPTCDYVWEPGVGFESNANSTTFYDKSRSELLRLLLVCLSATLYETPNGSVVHKNQWIEIFASKDNRHALPLFTSLLNVVFSYVPSKSLPFNHLLSYQDHREELVELSIQILIATLDHQFEGRYESNPSNLHGKRVTDVKGNLFIEYMTRIHRDEDFIFMTRGFARLLNNRIESQSYLLSSTKHINFEHELLILFWRICNLNKKFVSFLLKKTAIKDFVVPILYHLNENFQDASKTGIIHIGVFNLLMLSGEREFGVKLNKPYQISVLTNLPSFAGSHADLMIIVFHKLILYGQNLHQLFDFLLTIIVNISPYLKGLTMMASKCLIQLFEIFSSSFVIFTEPNHHQLVVFLLEIFNNLIQYQFDSNAHLIYAIINKREAFRNLANLPTNDRSIQKVLSKLVRKKKRHKDLIEKMLNENENQNSSSTCDGSSDGQQCNNKSISPSSLSTTHRDRIGATVSSNSNTNRCAKSHIKQEQLTSGMNQGVSLVATPDICRVTQPIHPFDTDNHSNSQIFFGPSNQGVEAVAPISFDDILDQSSSSARPSSSLISKSNSLLSDLETLVEVAPAAPDESQSNISDKNSPEIACRALVLKHDQGVGKLQSTVEDKKWRPTSSWAKEWKQSLPLHTSLRMIEVLEPQLNRFKEDFQKQQADENEMIKFLQDGTLVGLLPVPHPILIRKYHTNDETTLWFRACTWGIIYVRNSMWADTNIRVIKIV